ncbi:hypothetical protein CSUI_007611 [Cystoisospora suis]|uniref:Transmembrane protein n=1 Tax=Cystoisospora suis TaxID=483139 RepID=A0A2C6KM21_9APIC|nr:hypothetical protein CSUI_007611 [Cystoisospora suis]
MIYLISSYLFGITSLSSDTLLSLFLLSLAVLSSFFFSFSSFLSSLSLFVDDMSASSRFACRGGEVIAGS